MHPSIRILFLAALPVALASYAGDSHRVVRTARTATVSVVNEYCKCCRGEFVGGEDWEHKFLFPDDTNTYGYCGIVEESQEAIDAIRANFNASWHAMGLAGLSRLGTEGQLNEKPLGFMSLQESVHRAGPSGFGSGNLMHENAGSFLATRGEITEANCSSFSDTDCREKRTIAGSGHNTFHDSLFASTCSSHGGNCTTTEELDDIMTAVEQHDYDHLARLYVRNELYLLANPRRELLHFLNCQGVIEGQVHIQTQSLSEALRLLNSHLATYQRP
jgi:hypothetical protein